jgi:hypothetical protein
MFKQVPIFSRFDCIYTGPHVDENGKIDPRTWFSIPISLEAEEGILTYLVFPYGGGEHEVREVSADLLTGAVVEDGPSNF